MFFDLRQPQVAIFNFVSTIFPVWLRMSCFFPRFPLFRPAAACRIFQLVIFWFFLFWTSWFWYLFVIFPNLRGSRRSAKNTICDGLQTRIATVRADCRNSVRGRLAAAARRKKIQQQFKFPKNDKFGLDNVARNSSGLKPLRRRALRYHLYECMNVWYVLYVQRKETCPWY